MVLFTFVHQLEEAAHVDGVTQQHTPTSVFKKKKKRQNNSLKQ